jgi:hypothetical protein
MPSVADPDPSDPYRMLLGLLDPDPLVRGMDPGLRILILSFYQQAKIIGKTMIPTVL